LHVLSFCLFPRALQYGHISSRLAGIADRQDPPVEKEGHLMSFPKTISERFPAAESEANMQVEPDGEEAVPNDGTEKNPAR
jgi:hypothetical protein